MKTTAEATAWIVPKDNPTALVNPATRERIAFCGQEDCLKALKLLLDILPGLTGTERSRSKDGDS